MGYESPNVNLIDSNGNSLPVQSGSATPASTPALMVGGSDGTNSRYLLVDSSGRQITVGAGTAGTPAGGVVSIQGVAGGTAIPISGTVTANNSSVSTTGTTTPGSATLSGGTVSTSAPTYTTGNLGALSLTTSGLLRVDASATTITITGAVTQSGTWNINNISGTVSLPTGAATETSLAKLTLTQGSTTSGQSGTLNLAAVTTSAPTYTNGQTSPLTLDTSGALRVNVTAGGGSNASVSTVNTATPGSATYVGGAVATTAPTYTNGNMSALSLTTAGALRVDASGTPIVTTMGTTTTATLGALNATVTAPCNGIVSIGFQIGNGLNGTVKGQFSFDNVTWIDTYLFANNPGYNIALLILTGTGTWGQISLPPGANYVRIIVSAYTSGSASTLISTSDNTLPTVIPGGFAASSLDSSIAVSLNPSNNFVKLTDGNFVQAVKNSSTAAVASDMAAVVTLSPNNPVSGAVTTAAPSYTTGTTRALSLTTAGLLRVDSSGTTQPVSGTVAATQSGTWNITNISGTVSLPTGAATETSLAKLTLTQGSTTSGQSGSLHLGAVTTAAPTYTTGQSNPLSLTTGGLLRVDGSGVTQPVSGTVTVTQATAANLRSQTASEATTAAATGTVASLTGGAVTTAAPTYTTGQMNPLSLTTAGALRIDGSGVTQPVSGTVAATQSGAWNITNISGTVSLPTGAATEASLAKLTIAQGTALGTNTQVMMGGSVTTAAPTYTNGQISPLSLDTSGALRITGSISASNPSVSTTGSAPPASATYIGGSVTTAAPTYTTGQMSALSLNTAGNLRVTDSGVASLLGNGTNSGTIGALNDFVAITTSGGRSVGFFLVGSGGTFIGTLTPQISYDNGATWFNSTLFDGATALVIGGTGINGVGQISVTGGVTTVRMTATAYTSGSSTLFISATDVDRTVNALVDNAKFYDNSTRLIPTGQIFDEVAGTALTEDDIAVSRIDSKRAQVMVFEDATTRGQRASVNAAGSLQIEGQGLTGAPAGGVVTVQTADNRFAGAFTGLNATWNINMAGSSGAGFGLTSGTLIGTIVAEASHDGTNWTLTSMRDPATGLLSQSLVFATANPTCYRSIIVPAGCYQIRVRLSAFTSGTCQISIAASTSQDVVPTNVSDQNAPIPPTSALVGGQSGGTLRNVRVNRIGQLRVGNDTLLVTDSVEGSTVNSAVWTQATTTMTIAQATGVITLNNGSSVATTTNANLVTNKQFILFNHGVLKLGYRFSVTQGPTNAFIEIGLGAPSGGTATINNGAFIRINGTALSLVTAYNGTEDSAAQTVTLTNSTYYMLYMFIDEDEVKFVIEDIAGVPILDTSKTIPTTTPFISATTHLPAFARVRNSAAVGSAAQLKISSFNAVLFDLDTNKPWAEQLAGSGRSFNIRPDTFAQAVTSAAGAAPTGFIPNNTGSTARTTLGGEYLCTATATSENFLAIFAYTVPAPYSFVITDLVITPPVVTTLMGATLTIHQYCLMVASSTNPSTAAGQRYPIGHYSAAASAAVGTIFNGQALNFKYSTPIVVDSGKVLLIMVKAISGIATGAYRGCITVNGYYE